MHGAATAGHRAPQPLRVAEPLQGRPCSRRQISGSKLGDLLDADELADLLDVALAGALVADGRVAGAQDRALGRQRPGAVEGLDHGLQGRPDLRRLGRAAGDRVVHVHDLVQGAQDRLELGQVKDAFRNLVLPDRAEAFGVVRAGRREGGVDDLLAARQVGEAGDAALAGARPERDHELRLAAQEPGQVDRLVGAHGARHEGDRDLAVGHGLDVAVLAVHDGRPQDDVEGVRRHPRCARGC